MNKNRILLAMSITLFGFSLQTTQNAHAEEKETSVEDVVLTPDMMIKRNRERISKLSHLSNERKSFYYQKGTKAVSKTTFENIYLEALKEDKSIEAKEKEELKRIEEENRRKAEEERKRKEEAEKKRIAENHLQPLKVFEVTGKYESGNRSPGAILGELNDGAGMNYGTYSLTERYTMTPYLKFLSEKYPKLYEKLSGEVNSYEFNESWKALGKSDEAELKASQAEFIFKRSIIPAIDKLKKDTGIDLLDGSHSVGSVAMFSGMIHNAGMAWYPILRDTAIEIKKENPQQFNDVKFIEESGGWVANNYNGVYKTGIRNRYSKQPNEEKVRTEKFVYDRNL